VAVRGAAGRRALSSFAVLSKLLRALIDPSVAPVRALPRNEWELFISASSGHVLAFDNLSGCRPSIASRRLFGQAASRVPAERVFSIGNVDSIGRTGTS